MIQRFAPNSMVSLLEATEFGVGAAMAIIGQPRLALGAMLNTEGQTNQVYVGLNSQWPFVHDVFQSGDAIFLEGSVGGAWHDGKLDVKGTPEDADWKSRGSEFVFRTGFGFGYRFDEDWSVAVTMYHISNADLAPPNEGSNDIGVQVGYSF
jgi:lipid A 3-O-deacylase